MSNRNSEALQTMEFCKKSREVFEVANQKSVNAAVVLGLDVNGYGILQSLIKKKIPTIGIYGQKIDYGRFSRFCPALYLDCSENNEENSCRELVHLSKQFKQKPVLYITSDKHALFLSDYSPLLREHYHFHWVENNELLGIIDKAELSKYCEKINIAFPKTVIVNTGSDLDLICETLPFPCILKPCRSSGLNQNFPGKTFIARNPSELKNFYQAHPFLIGNTICQQIIEGEDNEVFQCNVLVNHLGAVTKIASVKKIHQYPAHHGHMSFGVTEENSEIAQNSELFLKELNYFGFASLEFKRQPKDGKYYFIEMNPRLPWYNSLFLKAEINFPYLAYLDLLGIEEANSPPIHANVYWKCLSDELERLKETKQLRSTLKNWSKSLGSKNAYCWWCLKDPLPFVKSVLALTSQIITNRLK